MKEFSENILAFLESSWLVFFQVAVTKSRVLMVIISHQGSVGIPTFNLQPLPGTHKLPHANHTQHFRGLPCPGVQGSLKPLKSTRVLHGFWSQPSDLEGVSNFLLLPQLGCTELLHSALGPCSPIPAASIQPRCFASSAFITSLCNMSGMADTTPWGHHTSAQPWFWKLSTTACLMPFWLSFPAGQQQSSNFFLGWLRASLHYLSVPWWAHTAEFNTKALGGPSLRFWGFPRACTSLAWAGAVGLPRKEQGWALKGMGMTTSLHESGFPQTDPKGLCSFWFGLSTTKNCPTA